MKLLSLFFLAVVLLMSCTKDQTPGKASIEGTWKLVKVYDGGLPYLSQPYGDVIITFTTAGTYSGHTIANEFSNGTFKVQDSNKVTFDLPQIQSQVNEEEWGRSLFVVLGSCGLQSVFPCKPCNYTVTGDELFIDSPMRYDILLKKQ